MNPLTAVLLGGSILGQFVSSNAASYAQAKAAANSAQAARIDGEYASIRGTEAAEQSEKALYQTLGTINAVQAARGVDDTSPSGEAITDETMNTYARNQGIARLNALQQVGDDEMKARAFATTSATAIPLGLLSSGTTAAGQIQRAFFPVKLGG